MQPDNKSLYTIKFTGDCADGHDRNAVRDKFARLFGVGIEDVEEIFTGRDMFFKKNLNRLTANQYRDAFAKIGAVFQLNEQTELNKTQPEDHDIVSEAMETDSREKKAEPQEDQNPDMAACPKCGHRQARKHECEACGIFFSKYEKMQERKNHEKIETIKDKFETAGDEDVNYEETREMPEAKKARFNLQVGTIILLFVFVFDSFVKGRGLDIGIMPYIIPHYFLVRGSFLIAILKGYPALTGLLGCASLFGISVLLLLPDRTAEDQPYKLDIGKFVAIVMMLVSLYWAGNYFIRLGQGTIKKNAFFDTRQELKAGRNIYPSMIFDSSPETFDAEFQQMESFITEGFTILAECSYRTDTAEKIAGSIFEELAALFIWIKYQQFLHAMEYKDLPEHLYEDNIDCVKLGFKKLIDGMLEKCGGLERNPGIAKAYGAWIHGCPDWDFTIGGTANIGTKHSQRLNRLLFGIKDVLRDRSLISSMNENHEGNYRLPEVGTLPKDLIAEAKQNGNIMEYRLAGRLGEMSGRKLIMVYFPRPYKQFGKLKYYDEFVCIGGDLPNIYMHSNFSVFHAWDMLGVMKCMER